MAGYNISRVIAFAALLLITFYFIVQTFWVLWKMLQRGRKDPELLGNFGERTKRIFVYLFGQKKLLRHPAGIGHFIIFYGFIFITIVASEVFVRAFFPGFSLSFLGVGYDYILFTEDVLSIGVLISLTLGWLRRFTPSIRMQGSKGLRRDALLIIYAVAIHLTFSNILESLELAEGTHPWLVDHPNATIGPFMAVALSKLWSGNLTLITNIIWWLHAFSVWLFLIYIVATQIRVPPFFPSKHMHIITIPFNIFFSNLKSHGRLQPINFEDESIEEYGVSKVEDFTWGQMLDFYTCTGCGRCQEVCPAFLSGQPLSPKSLILDLREQLLEKATVLKNEKTIPDTTIIGNAISTDTLWSCTTCDACVTACPVLITHIDKIIDLRREQVMMQSEFPKGLEKTFTNIEVNSNPWGIGKANRDLWAKDLDVKTMKDNPDTNVLYWVGCAGSFDERAKKVSTALVKILKAANIDFAILGKEEKCTGDPARRLGNEYLAQELITENVQILNSYKFKEIITACPHCFNTLANEFPDFDGHYRVVHAVEFVAKLLREGKLTVDKNIPLNITYHDSCYLGRHNGLYTEPREILKLVGIEMREMKMHGDQSMCCGGGGGRVWYENDTEGTDINKTRVEMAADTGADYIGVSCPFCTTMLEDGIKNTGKELEVVDLLEIVADRVIE